MLKLQETPQILQGVKKKTEREWEGWRSAFLFPSNFNIFHSVFFFLRLKQNKTKALSPSLFCLGPTNSWEVQLPPVWLLKWRMKEGLCQCLHGKVKSIGTQRTMEQRNNKPLRGKRAIEKKKRTVYHNTLGSKCMIEARNRLAEHICCAHRVSQGLVIRQ